MCIAVVIFLILFIMFYYIFLIILFSLQYRNFITTSRFKITTSRFHYNIKITLQDQDFITTSIFITASRFYYNIKIPLQYQDLLTSKHIYNSLSLKKHKGLIQLLHNNVDNLLEKTTDSTSTLEYINKNFATNSDEIYVNNMV